MTGVLAVNLWSPQHGLSVGVALLTAFLLGIVHGVTPDEHTWPITFSYALGSFSARKGVRSALAFSLAFTAQRALLSELAYPGLLAIRENATWNAAIYVAVGVVMPSAAFGWAPGAVFGLGTTAVLAGAGAVIGALIRHQRLPRGSWPPAWHPRHRRRRRPSSGGRSASPPVPCPSSGAADLRPLAGGSLPGETGVAGPAWDEKEPRCARRSQGTLPPSRARAGQGQARREDGGPVRAPRGPL